MEEVPLMAERPSDLEDARGVCRICLEEDTVANLDTPCTCKGSLQVSPLLPTRSACKSPTLGVRALSSAPRVAHTPILPHCTEGAPRLPAAMGERAGPGGRPGPRL